MRRSNPDITRELEGISPAVANLDPAMPYTVPVGYFEQLPAKILALVSETAAAGETRELSPLLASLKDKPTFSLPEGYFEQQLAAVQTRLQPSGGGDETEDTAPARVISLQRRLNWPRMAVAATVTVLLAVATWYFTGSPGQQTSTPIDLAATANGTEPDSIAVSYDALAGFLEETAALPGNDLLEEDSLTRGSQELAILDLSADRVSQMLEELPDQALESYVTENPDAGVETDMN